MTMLTDEVSVFGSDEKVDDRRPEVKPIQCEGCGQTVNILTLSCGCFRG